MQVVSRRMVPFSTSTYRTQRSARERASCSNAAELFRARMMAKFTLWWSASRSGLLDLGCRCCPSTRISRFSRILIVMMLNCSRSIKAAKCSWLFSVRTWNVYLLHTNILSDLHGSKIQDHWFFYDQDQGQNGVSTLRLRFRFCKTKPRKVQRQLSGSSSMQKFLNSLSLAAQCPMH